MADDHDPHCVEDIDDDEYEDEYEDEDEDDDDEPYDVNKEDDLGEPEDQAQDEFERRLDDFEISAERAPPIVFSNHIKIFNHIVIFYTLMFCILILLRVMRSVGNITSRKIVIGPLYGTGSG